MFDETDELTATPKGDRLEDKLPFRISILVCACLLTFGSYYCYDIPGAMTLSLEDVCLLYIYQSNSKII